MVYNENMPAEDKERFDKASAELGGVRYTCKGPRITDKEKIATRVSAHLRAVTKRWIAEGKEGDTPPSDLQDGAMTPLRIGELRLDRDRCGNDDITLLAAKLPKDGIEYVIACPICGCEAAFQRTA